MKINPKATRPKPRIRPEPMQTADAANKDASRGNSKGKTMESRWSWYIWPSHDEEGWTYMCTPALSRQDSVNRLVEIAMAADDWPMIRDPETGASFRGDVYVLKLYFRRREPFIVPIPDEMLQGLRDMGAIPEKGA